MSEVNLHPPQSPTLQSVIRIYFLQDNQSSFHYFVVVSNFTFYDKFDNFSSSISNSPSITSCATTSTS